MALGDEGELVLSGGFGSGSKQPNTWVLTGKDWSGPSASPERYYFGMVRRGDETLAVGGGINQSTNEPTRDVLEWTSGENMWALRVDLALPEPRVGMAIAHDSGRKKTVVFGGRTDASRATNDLLELDDTGTIWEPVEPTDPWPVPRTHHAMAYDPLHEILVVFGGATDGPAAGVELGDTWIYDGARFRPVTATPAPRPMRGSAMVYDATARRIVLFGGIAEGEFSLDTWEFDAEAEQWRNMEPAGVGTDDLSARGFSAIAYEPTRHGTVLFGGKSLSTVTWQYVVAGTPCGSDADCLYGLLCIDGLCCSTPCSSGVCNAPATPGTCVE